MYTELSRQIGLSLSCQAPLPERTNIVLCQESEAMIVAARVTALAHLIAHIVSVSPKAKVIDVDAGRVVADMHHDHALWYRAMIFNPHKPMHVTFLAARMAHLSVAKPGPSKVPLLALVSDAHRIAAFSCLSSL
jgi:hypothetical protein